jgi:ATP-dependent DNA helicase RecQ
MSQIQELLQRYWGHSSFRPQQRELVETILSGKDCIALLPTSAGKSVCFQLPSLVMPGVTLVVTPLVALMKNQVENLRKKRIWAEAIYSGLMPADIDRILDNCVYGEVKLLYVSPERLQSDLFLERFQKMNLNFVAVDEAHCVSDWGYDFRPAYLQIAKLRAFHPKVPFMALTASATALVKEDISKKLQLSNPITFKTSYLRSNIHYVVRLSYDKENQLITMLQKVRGSCIIYVKSRKKTEELAQHLNRHGISAIHYHAGLEMNQRDRQQQEWLQNRVRVMVATNAFGMGIDKPDVSLVVHWELPTNLEAYYQEAGRAGRNGLASYAVALYQPQDLTDLTKSFTDNYPPLQEIQRVYQAIANYLALAEGSGLGESYSVDPFVLSQRYTIPEKTVTAAFQILQHIGLLQLNEAFWEPSKFIFTLDNTQLYDFRLRNQKYDSILKALFQLYGLTAFNQATAISEAKLSTICKIPEQQIKQQLQLLHAAKVLYFTPQPSGTGITFLTPRKDVKQLGMYVKKYDFLKERAKSQLQEIINYIQNDSTCRQKQILSYFNEENLTDCGICDVCLEKKQPPIPLEQYITFVLKNLAHTNFSARELIQGQNQRQQKAIAKAIETLLDQEKISLEPNGKLQLLKT